MKELLIVGVLISASQAFTASDQINNFDRACPDGFFYAGEAVNNGSVTRESVWIEGPASPIYSCYKFIKAEKTFAGASLECNNIEAAASQLVSIEARVEDIILETEDFWNKIPEEMKSDLAEFGARTSGIELAPNNWTWFGSDMPVDNSQLFIDDMAFLSEDEGVNCLIVKWNKTHNHVSLQYEAVPCMQPQMYSLCEVHVYTQTWYVWFYANWLQILMFVTMLLLIFSACCLFQALFFRTRVRTGQPVTRQQRRPEDLRTVGQPPAYTASSKQPPVYSQQPPVYTTTVTQDESFINESPAERYIRKGKEIMAQVTFFKPSQQQMEKSPLPQ